MDQHLKIKSLGKITFATAIAVGFTLMTGSAYADHKAGHGTPPGPTTTLSDLNCVVGEVPFFDGAWTCITVPGPGDDGSDGAPGADGADGVAGADGADGSDGAPGADGSDGVAGADGSDGVAGADGADGADGAVGGTGDNVVYTPSIDDNMHPYSVIHCVIALVGTFPSPNFGYDDYLGSIGWFAGNFPPHGWVFCDGQLLSISQEYNLFSLLGTTYGGDGQTTFGVPDMRGRSPVHVGGVDGTGTNRAWGSKGGSATEAPHNHGHTAAP